MFCTFWLVNVVGAAAACNFSTCECQKVVCTPQFFDFFYGKCASRYSGVQFLNIVTAKIAPKLRCFVHFDLQIYFAPQRHAIFSTSQLQKVIRTRQFFNFKMCFSLQRRAIFPHANFKKWSEPVSFLAFWLQNVLRATAAYKFSSLLSTATSAPAALPRLLFDPADPQTIKNTTFRNFPTFSRLWIF